MFARKKNYKGKIYIRIVENYRCGSTSKHRIISSLGPFDEDKFVELRALCRDFKRLGNAKNVIEDLNDSGSALQGKGYFFKFRRF